MMCGYGKIFIRTLLNEEMQETIGTISLLMCLSVENSDGVECRWEWIGFVTRSHLLKRTHCVIGSQQPLAAC